MEIFSGITIPFLGTALGAACVFLMKRGLKNKIQGILAGFAAGIMLSASIWSLLIPAAEQAESLGSPFIPAAIGLTAGFLLMLLLDKLLPQDDEAENMGRTGMLMLALTLHNLPEGIAVGIVCAGFLTNTPGLTSAGVMALIWGITIQNFPEGAIISLPLHGEGMSKWKSFLYGAASGIVEPIGTALAILAAEAVVPAMPYLLNFAAGAMIYVAVEELIPRMQSGTRGGKTGIICFAIGFTLMTVLDVALG